MAARAKMEVTETGRLLADQIGRRAKGFDDAAEASVKHVAKACAESVKARIVSQAFPNVRLTPAWLARKAKKGWDLRTLLATQTYFKSIRAEKAGDGSWGVVCSDDVLRKRLEYGTKTSPPRPHWTPVLLEMKTKFGEKFGAEIAKKILDGDDS